MPGPGGEAWTEDDVEYALAWQALTTGDCSGCGQPLAESFDPANEGEYDVSALRCHACTAKDRHRAEFEEAGGEMAGLFLSVTKPRRSL